MSGFRRRLMMAAASASPLGKYIQFEDAEVERICVQNFSSDGIGVSYEDAEKVTDIRELFRNNIKVKTFNEFKYFINITSLRGNAFSASTITHITFPPNLIEIRPYCFMNSELEGDLHLPNSLQNITQQAFDSCKFTKIFIGENIKNIQFAAFIRCVNVVIIVCRAKEPPTLGSFNLNQSKVMESIYVPNESVQAYKTAGEWSNYSNKIKPLSTYIE